MSSASISETRSRDRYRQDEWSQSTQDTASAGSGKKRAVFESPEAKNTLSYLQERDAPTSKYTDPAARTYQRMADQTGQDTNPYVEALIKDENAVAETGFQNRLAQTRAGAYRGGTGANMYAQDKVGADFQAQLSQGNNQLRYGAYDDAQNRALSSNVSGAAGLAGLRESDIGTALQQKGFATQLLALLRGEDVANEETVAQKNQRTGGFSGTKSGQSVTGSYTYGGGGGGG